MKTLKLLLIFLLTTSFVRAQIVNIPDANFKNRLLSYSTINTNADSEIQISEAIAYNGHFTAWNVGITDLTGIEAFVNLTSLDVSGNNIASIDLSSNNSLVNLDFANNNVSSINLTQNTALKSLDASGNPFLSIDLSNNVNLSYLALVGTDINVLDVSNNVELTFLSIAACNSLASIDLTNNVKLDTLDCAQSGVLSLDLSNNTNLTWLRCEDNGLNELDLSNNTLLEYLNLRNNALTFLDLSANINLTLITVAENSGLKGLDLSQNVNLEILRCFMCSLEMLNISKCVNLTSIYCDNNNLGHVDFSKNLSLETIYCGNNEFVSLDFSANSALTLLRCEDNLNLTSLDITNCALTVNQPIDNNPNLFCVTTHDPVYFTSNWIANIDPQTSFSGNCSCGAFQVSIDSITNVSCQDSGRIYTSTSGLNGPFSYQWINYGSNDSTLVTDSSGIYVVKVSDANNCERLNTAVLSGPKGLVGFDFNSVLVRNDELRPGNIANFDLVAINELCLSIDGTLCVSYSGPIDFISSSVAPDSIVANRLYWYLDSITYNNKNFFSDLSFSVDSSSDFGDLVCFDINLTPILGDADSTNNSASYCYEVLDSFDPNDKQVKPQGICNANYTLVDKPLTYTVRFQNLGNASAIDIYIVDTISPYLNVSTLELIYSSHDGVVIEALDPKVLRFRFDGINLPDSASDPIGSKGYIVFQLTPYSGLIDGSIIENRAYIYFDLNPPVITNTTSNTMVEELPGTIIIPNIISFEQGDSVFLENQYFDSDTIIYQNYVAVNGCDSIVENKLSMLINFGITDMNSGEIKIYPNPNNGKFTVSSKEELSGNSRVRILNAMGQIIYNRSDLNSSSMNKINIEDQADGIYFIEISDGDKVSTSTIIKK